MVLAATIACGAGAASRKAAAPTAWIRVLTPMRALRDAHGAILAGAGVLLIGGRTRAVGATTRTVDCFQPQSGIFTRFACLRRSRSFFVPILLENGRILVAGGYRQPNPHGTASDAELFDPAQGRWLKVARMAVARELYTATTLPDGRVLFAGGFSNGAVLMSAETYYPRAGRTGKFRATRPMAIARFGHAAVALPGGVLVCGGRNAAGRSLRETELYDANAGSWRRRALMVADRFRATATVLEDGRVLIAGGYSSSAGKTLDTAEVYDPARDRFTLLPSRMSDGRMDHTATLLPDGRVLVVAGWSSEKGVTVPSADIFDPVTNRFAPAPPLPVSRHEHTATLLPDGRVLVAGGLRHDAGGETSLSDAYTLRP